LAVYVHLELALVQATANASPSARRKHVLDQESGVGCAEECLLAEVNISWQGASARSHSKLEARESQMPLRSVMDQEQASVHNQAWVSGGTIGDHGPWEEARGNFQPVPPDDPGWVIPVIGGVDARCDLSEFTAPNALVHSLTGVSAGDHDLGPPADISNRKEASPTSATDILRHKDPV
jgi:hypothetical protein